MKQYFVTGTDTGVGKTHVAAALARRARARGATRVFAFKPIETGCRQVPGDDQQVLVEAAGSWQRGLFAGVYQFQLPAAPSVAARAVGVTIDLTLVMKTFSEGSHDAQLSILEGAGGWRVPITERTDMAGLARVMQMPVIVVARAGLGTINQALLTLESVERHECTVAALVLSRQPQDDLGFAVSNAEEIARWWPGRILLLDQDPRVLDPLC